MVFFTERKAKSAEGSRQLPVSSRQRAVGSRQFPFLNSSIFPLSNCRIVPFFPLHQCENSFFG